VSSFFLESSPLVDLARAGFVKVYEGEIENAALQLEGLASRSELRELVRLHEHSHAFLHRVQLNLHILQACLAGTELDEQAEQLVARASARCLGWLCSV